MSFTFIKCPIEGLYEIQPEIHGDARGYFIETYKKEEFFAAEEAKKEDVKIEF